MLVFAHCGMAKRKRRGGANNLFRFPHYMRIGNFLKIDKLDGMDELS